MELFRKLPPIIETLQKVQIIPATIRVEPNDKDTKVLFHHNAENYQRFINGKNFNVVEKIVRLKNGEKSKIRTRCNISNSDGYSNNEPLNEFDRAVLSVCISELLAGNEYTTPAIIFRALIGRVGDNLAYPKESQVKAIQNSIDKLMLTNYECNADESLKKMKYEHNKNLPQKSAVLPCFRVETIINGQKINAVFFDRESPVFSYADARHQVLRYDASLLDTPGKNNDLHVITVKNYIMRRTIEIVSHKNLNPSITFDDIFAKCNLKTSSNKVKANIRDVICLILDNLQIAKIIKGYEGKKRGFSWHSVFISR